MTSVPINKYGIVTGDIYSLIYYGVYIYFQVTKITTNSVFLVELGTKKFKKENDNNNYVTFLSDCKPTKKPLVVLENNVFTKTKFEICPILFYGEKEAFLPIEVKQGSKLHLKAMELNKRYVPANCYAYATFFKHSHEYHCYWKEIETEKIIQKNNELENEKDDLPMA